MTVKTFLNHARSAGADITPEEGRHSGITTVMLDGFVFDITTRGGNFAGCVVVEGDPYWSIEQYGRGCALSVAAHLLDF